jgi:DNA-binding NarL/FixJ family response regulator
MNATILIVDDHDAFRSWARCLLQASGFVVVGEASKGVQAIETAEQVRPDLVLLDVQLPDIDGLLVARRLAALARAPIVVLTSSRDASDYGLRLGACGARGFIPKSKLSVAALEAFLDDIPRS